uniref:Uncharacterized protein n=1 Tax=Cannabis sativa TaxID=3483 RepID=A0A803NPQ6_CANSA
MPGSEEVNRENLVIDLDNEETLEEVLILKRKANGRAGKKIKLEGITSKEMKEMAREESSGSAFPAKNYLD